MSEGPYGGIYLGRMEIHDKSSSPPVRLSLSFHAQGLLLKLCKLLQIRQYHLVGSTSPCGIQHQLPQIHAPNPMHPKHLWFLHWAGPSFFIRNQVPLSNTARSRGVPAPVMPESLPRVTNHRNHKPHLRRHASSITQLCLSWSGAWKIGRWTPNHRRFVKGLLTIYSWG